MARTPINAAPQQWLAERIETLRPTRSQRGLAQHLGLPSSRVAEMIAGVRKIAVSELPLIAEYLGLTVEEVVKRISGEKPPSEPLPPIQGVTDDGVPYGTGPLPGPGETWEVWHSPTELLRWALRLHEEGKVVQASALARAYATMIDADEGVQRGRARKR